MILPSRTDKLASIAGRILKGEKPSDLPVQLVTKVELFLNLKAAAALNISISPSMISSADVVIE